MGRTPTRAYSGARGVGARVGIPLLRTRLQPPPIPPPLHTEFTCLCFPPWPMGRRARESVWERDRERERAREGGGGGSQLQSNHNVIASFRVSVFINQCLLALGSTLACFVCVTHCYHLSRRARSCTSPSKSSILPSIARFRGVDPTDRTAADDDDGDLGTPTAPAHAPL
jgi:hypothetical protein